MTEAKLTSSANITIGIGRTETGSVRIVVIDTNGTICMVVNPDGAKWIATELLRAAGVEDTAWEEAIARCIKACEAVAEERRSQIGEVRNWTHFDWEAAGAHMCAEAILKLAEDANDGPWMKKR